MNTEAEKLVDCIFAEHNILCDFCDKSESVCNSLDDFDAANYFYANGWRLVKREAVYCPECMEGK